MVHEVRRVTLNEAELASAIESYRRITPNFLPEGKLTSCKVMDTTSVEIVLEIMAGSQKQNIEMKLTDQDILKPLIRFCIENNIMLPRDGQKEAFIEQDAATLRITLDLNIDLSENVNPMRISHLKVMKPSETVNAKEVAAV